MRLVVLLLAIQALAHLAGRLMQARQAMALSALAPGFVSGTATGATLGLKVRREGAPPVASARAALPSCVATLLQLLMVAAGTNTAWLPVLGLTLHALARCVNAALSGGWRYALAFVPGQLVHTAVCVAALICGSRPACI